MAKNTVWHTEYSAWSLEALVEEINRLNYWEMEACKELCKRARLATDWEDADADTFEEVIYHAAEILGVVID